MRPPRAVSGATWRWGGNAVWESWDLMIGGVRVGWVAQADEVNWKAIVERDGQKTGWRYSRTKIAVGTKAACARALALKCKEVTK